MIQKVIGKTIERSQNDEYLVKSLVPEGLTIGEVIGPKEFIKYQKLVKAGYPEKEQCHITVRDYDELKDATCIRLNKGDGYVAVMKDGEIVSVLKNATSNVKDLCTTAFASADMIGMDTHGNKVIAFEAAGIGPIPQEVVELIDGLSYEEYIRKIDDASVTLLFDGEKYIKLWIDHYSLS